MNKIEVTGKGARIVATLIVKNLRDSGFTVNFWRDVSNTKEDRAECSAAARKEKADFLVMSF